MKLNDIYTDLNKTIHLNKKKKNKEFILEPLKANIDNFNSHLNSIIKLNKKKKIIINKKNKKNIDSINKKISKKIDLKKIIQNQKLINKLINSIKDLFIYKKNKTIKIKTNKINQFKNNTNIDKNNTYKIKNKFKYFIYFLTIDFLLANLLFWLSILNLKNISSNNYESKIKNSYILSNLSELLYFPFKIVPISNLQNTIHTNSIIKNTDLILLKYINLYKNNKNSKLFLTDTIKENREEILSTQENINKIKSSLSKIKLDKNPKYYSYLTNYKEAINILNLLTQDLKNNSNILSILWDKEVRKYLVLFQNNDEIRATWGFPGSVWIISIYKWKIVDFKKEDIYKLEWDINKEYKKKIKAPYWLDKVNPYLTLKDSNFYSSYFQSANPINFFLQKWEFKMDWIAFINTNTINEILKVIWWVYFKDIDEKINEDNFNELISILVEAKISKKWTLWTPKKILFDFAKKLEEKIKKNWNIKKIAKILINDIKNREIWIILFNKNENEFIRKLWLNSDINFDKYTNYIYPIYTSLSQNKSDRYLDINYNITTKQTRKYNKCNYETNLNITLKHTFTDNDKQRLLNNFKKYNITNNTEKLLNIQWQWNNKQFVKIILPKWSIISAKTNSNIWKNVNSNLITFFTDLKPWEKKQYNFKYKIQNKECDNYIFSLLKQPWIKKYNINYKFINYSNQTKELKFENLKKDFYYIEK